MRRLVTIILLFLMVSTAKAASWDKVINTGWVSSQWLKWGYVGAICTTQSLNGMVDGYHFRHADTHLVNEGNYHAFASGARAGSIITGWFMYANYKDKKQTSWGKVKRIIGGAMLARNCFEWSYKGVKYGNPFDYDARRNEHALVYFGIREGKIADLYIGTGPVSGPIVDMAFLLIGWSLIR